MVCRGRQIEGGLILIHGAFVLICDLGAPVEEQFVDILKTLVL